MCRELKKLRSSGVVVVCDALIKAIWTFSKFSLILLWKGFGGVTHRSLLDPKFGCFTSKFVDFLDQKWTPKMNSFRHARRATLPCGCNLVTNLAKLFNHSQLLHKFKNDPEGFMKCNPPGTSDISDGAWNRYPTDIHKVVSAHAQLSGFGGRAVKEYKLSHGDFVCFVRKKNGETVGVRRQIDNKSA